MQAIRIPGRVAFSMSASGWGQRAEVVRDYARTRLLAILDGRSNADGSYTVPDPDPVILARLVYEADHLADSFRYGDHDSDTLADYNAAQAMQRRVDATLGRRMALAEAHELMYACIHGLRTCYACGIGDLDSSG